MDREKKLDRAAIDTTSQEDAIPYRPIFSKMTGGSKTSAILLQQIIFTWRRKGYETFYKFKVPCDHKLCRPNDTWAEELHFSRYEYDSAIKNIGTKVTRGTSKTDLMSFKWPDLSGMSEEEAEKARREAVRHIVIYWTDSGRVTWYWLNERLYRMARADYSSLGKMENSPYLENRPSDISDKAENSISQVTGENHFTYS